MKLLEEPRSLDARMPPPEAAPVSDPMPHLIGLFRLLADDRRMQIVRLLIDGDQYVGALCEKLGQTQPAVSHHLGLLCRAGLIERRRAGKRNFYHFVPAKLEEVLDGVFAGKPPAERRVRLGKYILSCSE